MIKKILLNQNQRKINTVKPRVDVTLNEEIPVPSAREIPRLVSLVARVNSFEEELKTRPDIFFKEKTEEFKRLIKERTHAASEEGYILCLSSALDEVLPFCFAMVREAARRTIKLRHFDVQILGGIVLHKNKIAEMATGEGKTLVATLAVSLNALAQRGVHVVTVNDYLARRDSEWMGPVYKFLGLSCGVIQQDMGKEERRAAYRCDVTYGTNNEFGFDYLRDNMSVHEDEMVQSGHFYAIVDEVDSILVDEARTPLIISGPSEVAVEKYYRADRAARQLKVKKVISRHDTKEGIVILKNSDGTETKTVPEEIDEKYDALVEEKTHIADLTKRGEEKCETLLGIKSVAEDTPDPFSNVWKHYITQSLRAHCLFKKDRDYITKEGKVVIVDEFTGRLMPGRRWSDGLHQGVEAKENLKIQEESQTLATITLQNYFRMYTKRAGMTGTAYTEASEFRHIYDLDVVVIPTNRPLHRANFTDRVYKSKRAKFNAVVSEIEEAYGKKRPVLVGTTSIEDSEELAFMLSKCGIPHNVLNAKYHEREAHIVAQAGRLGQITIATNMAGRGTDIILGGNIDFFVKDLLTKSGISVEDPDYIKEYERIYNQYISKFQEEHNKVVVLGGLHVIGTQRHEARRIDNQLRGRAGRQGDPGSSRFYISLEDDLMRLFGSEKIYGIMDRLGFPEDDPIEYSIMTSTIEKAQRKVEAYNFEIRKQLLKYDNVMNKQREVIYRQRQEVLTQENIKEEILEMIDDVLGKKVVLYIQEGDYDSLLSWVKVTCNTVFESSDFEEKDTRYITDIIERRIRGLYDEKEKKIGAEAMRFLEKWAALRSIDRHWKEHLLIMDSLKEGIHLRGYAQTDPLVEYQKESHNFFNEMIEAIKDDIVTFMLKAQPSKERQIATVFANLPKHFVHSEYSPLDKAQPAQPSALVKKPVKKVGRNEPCPCGSGKKYKKCCGR